VSMCVCPCLCAFAPHGKAQAGCPLHFDRRRGRLYVTLGMPPSGPPPPPGAVVVRPTGNPQLGNGAVRDGARVARGARGARRAEGPWLRAFGLCSH
jgi:hypothetical protein